VFQSLFLSFPLPTQVLVVLQAAAYAAHYQISYEPFKLVGFFLAIITKIAQANTELHKRSIRKAKTVSGQV